MIPHSTDDGSLIGYDPLAWMQGVNNEALDQIDESALIKNDACTEVGSEISISDDEAEIKESESPANNIITLEASQTIQNITLLHERLALALESGERIDIDASAITTIDTATLQLLLIMTRTAIRLQREVVIDFPSDRFIEAARLLGLAELLGVEQSAAGFF